MTELFSFECIDYSQIDMLKDKHLLIFLNNNSRHNPLTFINQLKRCPDISYDFPFFFYIFKNNKIVASVKTYPDILYVEEKKYKWAWTGDLFTDQAYRGQGAASFLWERMTDFLNQRNYFIGGTFANSISIHILRKMGFIMTNRAHRLLFLKTARPFLSAHSKNLFLNKLIDAGYRFFIHGLKKTILKPINPDDLNLWIKKLNHTNNFEDLYNSNGLFYNEQYHFNDTAPKLKWKMENTKNYTHYLVFDKISKEKIFYVIFKSRRIKHKFAGRYSDFNLMTLMDFGTYTGAKKNIDRLLSFLEMIFWESNAEIFEIVTSNPYFIRKTYRKGFLKVGRGEAFLFKPPSKKILDDRSEKIENWHFTHFIADAYSFK